MTPGSERPAPRDAAVVGRVVRPHGLTGEFVVEPSSPGSTQFAPGSSLWIDGSWRIVTTSRAHGVRWVIGVTGVSDRDAAERLRSRELAVEADELPALEGDRYYIHDLVGCRVESPTGDHIGDVVGVAPGPQDWLEIETDGDRSLVPMARALLRKVDLRARRIVVDVPPGLVEATKDGSGRKNV